MEIVGPLVARLGLGGSRIRPGAGGTEGESDKVVAMEGVEKENVQVVQMGSLIGFGTGGVWSITQTIVR